MWHEQPAQSIDTEILNGLAKSSAPNTNLPDVNFETAGIGSLNESGHDSDDMPRTELEPTEGNRENEQALNRRDHEPDHPMAWNESESTEDEQTPLSPLATVPAARALPAMRSPLGSPSINHGSPVHITSDAPVSNLAGDRPYWGM